VASYILSEHYRAPGRQLPMLKLPHSNHRIICWIGITQHGMSEDTAPELADTAHKHDSGLKPHNVTLAQSGLGFSVVFAEREALKSHSLTVSGMQKDMSVAVQDFAEQAQACADG